MIASPTTTSAAATTIEKNAMICPSSSLCIRLNATNTSNVVVYTVEVSVENPKRQLMPYMTANLQFEVERRDDVLKVPNSALRFRPSPNAAAKGSSRDVKDQPGKGTVWVQTRKVGALASWVWPFRPTK